MDVLGERITRDKSRIATLQQMACAKRIEADKLDREADEIARLLECARRLYSNPSDKYLGRGVDAGW